MITVTEQAKEKLKQALRKQTTDPEVAMRITANYHVTNRLELILDKEKYGDMVVHSSEGKKVLLVRPEIATALKGVVIDYRKTGNGKAFIVAQSPETQSAP